MTFSRIGLFSRSCPASCLNWQASALCPTIPQWSWKNRPLKPIAQTPFGSLFERSSRTHTRAYSHLPNEPVCSSSSPTALARRAKFWASQSSSGGREPCKRLRWETWGPLVQANDLPPKARPWEQHHVLPLFQAEILQGEPTAVSIHFAERSRGAYAQGVCPQVPSQA